MQVWTAANRGDPPQEGPAPTAAVSFGWREDSLRRLLSPSGSWTGPQSGPSWGPALG